jgi:hypothetical protein
VAATDARRLSHSRFGRVPRAEVFGLLAIAGGVLVFYAWSGQFWIDVVDEGYFLDLSSRVLHGALPYRDFDTYYTPGVFYLFALVLKLFGASMLPIRLLMAGVRAAIALLLLVLGRRCAPWPIAVLPLAILLLLDHWPIEPEPHPSWPALLACLLAMELTARHLGSSRRRWLALAGAAAGLSFLFKQNTGAFTLLALVGYVLLRPRPVNGLLLRVGRVSYAIGSGAMVTFLLWPNLDPLFAATLWLPAIATLALMGARGFLQDSGNLTDGVRESLPDLAVVVAAFALVTIVWLAPLVVALGPDQTPLGLFVGSVNETGLVEPFVSIYSAGVPLLLVATWIPLALGLYRRQRRARLVATCAATAVTVLLLSLPADPGGSGALTSDEQLLPLLTALNDTFGALHLYLPALAAWAGVAALAFGIDSKSSVSSPGVWYLLFGVLLALTLYPRVDASHVLVASPPILLAGAWALAQVDRSSARAGTPLRLTLMAALLLVPAAALSPQIVWRLATIASPDAERPRLAYESVGLQRAPMMVPVQVAEDTRGVVQYIQDNTPPGTPLLVYPAAPLLNFLSDRPNPTRFDHFLPGALSQRDFAQVIDALERSRPPYVIWDHRGVIVWQTDEANRPLSDYIWQCYQQVASFNLYLVLERRSDAVSC